MESGPKFNMVEIIIASMICIIIDIISFFADFIAVGVGGFFIQALSWFVFVFWFKMKGIDKETSIEKLLPKLAIQIIPLIPTYTFTFLYTVYRTNIATT